MERLPRDRILDLLPLAAAAWVTWMVIGTWMARLYYPFDLEWMEGGMLTHVWRLQQGLELYPEPSPDFISFVYPPAYASIVAILSYVFPIGHALGRAVTCGGTLAAALAIVVGVSRHGGSAAVGCMAAAVFLGTYESSGGFMDLVRPDSWHVALLAWAIVAGLEDRRGAPMASGFLLAASFLFKHNAAAYGFPILLGIALRSGLRQGVIFGLSAALPALAATLYLQGVSDGRFLAYILGVPGSHPMKWNRAFPSGMGELGKALAIPIAASAGWLWFRTRALARVDIALAVAMPGVLGLGVATYGQTVMAIPGVKLPDPWVMLVTFGALGVAVGSCSLIAVSRLWSGRVSWRWAYGTGVVLVAIVTALLMRAHHGGFINVFLPVHWVLCFAFGIAAARLRRDHPGWVASGVIAAVFCGHLGLTGYTFPTDKFAPTDRDLQAGLRVVARVAECEGPVHSPYAAWIPYQAGFEPSMHAIALWDVTHKNGPFRAHVEGLHAAAADHYWGCVIDGGTRPLGISILKHYELKETLQIPPGAMRPRTGWPARPTRILVPADP